MLNRRMVYLFILLLIAGLFGVAGAEGPELLVYSGIIPQGINQGDGYYDITFSLYGSQEGGDVLWNETQKVYVYHGTFAVYLGAANRLNLPFDAPYWVGVKSGGKEEIWPLVGAAYPVFSGDQSASSGSAGAVVQAVAADEVLSANIKEADNASGQNTNAGSGVKTGHIANNAVTAAKIAANAVVTAKIANNAVTTAKIADGSIQAADIADGAVTDAKITGPISTSKITQGPGSTLNADTVDGKHAADFSVSTHNHDSVYVNTAGDSMTGPLTVNSGAISTAAFTGLKLQYYYVSGEGAIMSSYNDGYGYLSFYTKQGAGYPITRRMTIDKYGSVGIGTTSPGAKLHVKGAGFPNSFLYLDTDAAAQDSGIRLYENGVVKSHIYWAATPGNLRLYTNFGYGIDIMPSGNVGLGTSAPSQKLHVNGSYALIEGAGGEKAYIGGDGWGSDVQIGSLNTNISNVAVYNPTSGKYMHLYIGALHVMGGADLSEKFDVRKPAEELKPLPGMVVSIDPEHQGGLVISSQEYDRKVAGIISGAGGVNTGMVMGQEGSIAGGSLPVALTGRVYVLADASSGPIIPGDLLTTSDVPGHAMKVKNHEMAQGAVIGKAMTSLESGRGLVLVLVSLQ